MSTELKASGVKLEKKEGAWTNCGGVNDSLNINLRRVRLQILNYFQSSRYWTAWSWVKSEWLLARKNGRLEFLLECQRQGVVPRFIGDKIKTRDLVGPNDQRVVNGERRLCLQVLSSIIRKEFQQRNRLRVAAVENRKTMMEYGKEDYLFTRQRKDCLVEEETKASRKRLARKLKQLTSRCSRASSFSDRERVTCIGIEIEEAERSLLEKGPKFVPSQRKLNASQLRNVETEVEHAGNQLRWRQAEGEEETSATSKVTLGEEKLSEDSDARDILLDKKLRRDTGRTSLPRQPQRMDVDMENAFIRLKRRIVEEYGKYHPGNENTSKKERLAMKNLMSKERV